MTTLHTAQTLLLEGPDAASFAQSQFSNNVAALADGQWQFSAWLDAQGRVRHLFHLARLDAQRLLLLLRGGDAADMTTSLQRFVLRARVTLTPSNTHLLARGDALSLFEMRERGDTLILGCGDHSLRVGSDANDDNDWCATQLRLGWPWLPHDTLGTLLPPALSLYRLPAVALDKGCYPGQELVARLHYRGGHKRHLHLVALSRAVASGTALHDAEGSIVQLLQVHAGDHRNTALAIIPDNLHERLSSHLPLITREDVQLRVEAGWGN
jgi:folate-binding protein YgfZ